MDDSFVGMVVGVFATVYIVMLVAAIAGTLLRDTFPRLFAFSRSETPWLAGQCASAVTFASTASIDVLEGQIVVGALAVVFFAFSTMERLSARRRKQRPA